MLRVTAKLSLVSPAPIRMVEKTGTYTSPRFVRISGTAVREAEKPLKDSLETVSSSQAAAIPSQLPRQRLSKWSRCKFAFCPPSSSDGRGNVTGTAPPRIPRSGYVIAEGEWPGRLANGNWGDQIGMVDLR